MITKAIDKLLPNIVTEKVNSLAGEEWNTMIKNIDGLADITRSVRTVEGDIGKLLETMDKYKGLVELSNDCKLMLKYYDIFRRYWSRLMAYSKICLGKSLDDAFEGEMVIMHITDEDWNWFEKTTVECVAAEDVIRQRLNDPKLAVDVVTAQRQLLEATEERNKIEKARKEPKEKEALEKEIKEKEKRHKGPKLSSEVTLVKSVTNEERDKRTTTKPSSSKPRNDDPEPSKKSHRGRSPPPGGSGASSYKSKDSSRNTSRDRERLTKKSNTPPRSGGKSTSSTATSPRKSVHDSPERSTSDKEEYSKKVVKVLLSKTSRKKPFMDTSIIGEREYPLFKEQQEARLDKTDARIKVLLDEKEKIHNQIDSVEGRLERERRAADKREREEKRRQEDARREKEQLEELRRANERYHYGHRNRFTRERF